MFESALEVCIGRLAACSLRWWLTPGFIAAGHSVKARRQSLKALHVLYLCIDVLCVGLLVALTETMARRLVRVRRCSRLGSGEVQPTIDRRGPKHILSPGASCRETILGLMWRASDPTRRRMGGAPLRADGKILDKSVHYVVQ